MTSHDRLCKVKWIAASLLIPVLCSAQGTVFNVPTREGVVTKVYWEPVENAKTTVLLFPGGGGGFGKVENGQPTGGNFLVRSVPHFTRQGYNVAIFGRPDDSTELEYADRIAWKHLKDVRGVMGFIQSKSAAPVWVMGTSRGTISATAAAIEMQGQLAGLVLASSIVNPRKAGALPTQDLSKIKIPVMVLHHSSDGCVHCRPADVPQIVRSLTNAPFRKLVMVDGGSGASGDPCGGQHWHGFVGMEKEAVDAVAAFINKPAN